MRFEGYAIISEDGMIADAAGHMPAVLTVEADQKFFQGSLDRAAVVVHGRHSHEGGPRASARKRLIVTTRVAGFAPDPVLHGGSILWNPAATPLGEALRALGLGHGTVAVIGGADVYELFWQPGYDAFHLTRVAGARLPGGRPVFRALASNPGKTPEEVLASHGLDPGPEMTLAPGVTLVTWRPAPAREVSRNQLTNQ
jgi:dihydrofolate reductase